jgi:hypothetical protein
MTNAFTLEQANAIYDVLVRSAGASDADRASFVHEFTHPRPTHEWRFQGRLGFGGKFRHNGRSAMPGIYLCYVDCYPEDLDDARRCVIEETNAELQRMFPWGTSRSPDRNGLRTSTASAESA